LFRHSAFANKRVRLKRFRVRLTSLAGTGPEECQSPGPPTGKGLANPRLSTVPPTTAGRPDAWAGARATAPRAPLRPGAECWTGRVQETGGWGAALWPTSVNTCSPESLSGHLDHLADRKWIRSAPGLPSRGSRLRVPFPAPPHQIGAGLPRQHLTLEVQLFSEGSNRGSAGVWGRTDTGLHPPSPDRQCRRGTDPTAGSGTAKIPSNPCGLPPLASGAGA
jgi:hypothetical protein